MAANTNPPSHSTEIVEANRTPTKHWFDWAVRVSRRLLTLEETAQAATDAVAGITAPHVPSVYPIAGETVVYGSVDTDYQIGLHPSVIAMRAIQGPPGQDGEPGEPGPPGPPGATGPAGSGGSGSGQTIFLTETFVEEGWPIPGPRGDTGATGASGGGGSGAVTNLGTATVVGAAVTTLTLTPTLPLSSFKKIELVFTIKNGTGSAAQVSLYYNADTTASNYYIEYLVNNGGSPNAGRLNVGILSDIAGTTGSATGTADIIRDVDGRPRANILTSRDAAASIISQFFTHVRDNTADVTSITLSASVAGGLGVGTTMTAFGYT